MTKDFRMIKNRDENTEFNVIYINVDGLNKEKLKEIEDIIETNKNTLFLIAETHMKYDEFRVSSNLDRKMKMRKIDDKKGGGLMALY